MKENTLLSALDWQIKSFGQMSNAEIYAVLAARSKVFVVEQHCIYQDVDSLDDAACHVLAVDHADPARPLAAYARLMPPDAAEDDARLGRVLVTPPYRGLGLGIELVRRALEGLETHWAGRAVRLHAQAHLTNFYRAFGFAALSEPHDYDGIPHVWMRREANVEVNAHR